jgi:ubiquinone/menaquinone biosynthesis C-methylase UbiE
VLQECPQMAVEIELLHGIAEKLPFRDESFDVVFHVGGINAFEDKSQAIKEMIRVAKPGTKIVIADEWLDPRTLKRFGERLLCKVFPSIVTRTQPPIELIPGDMLEIQINPIWKHYGYCIEFRKPKQHELGQ